MSTPSATPASGLYLDVCGPPGASPIVFLHPSGSNASAWASHLRVLSDGYRCLAVDLPGHRHSRHVNWVSLESTADAIADLIAEQPGGRASVVGLSLGGSLALTLMARHPQVIDRVVVDGAGALPNPWAWALKAAVATVSPVLHRRLAIRGMAAGLGVDPSDFASFADGMRAIPPSVFRRAFCQAQDVRISQELLRFGGPVLLVAGEKEPRATRTSNVTLATLLPNATARFLPGAGHAWMVARSELHIEMVRSWVEDRPLPDELQPETSPPPSPERAVPATAPASSARGPRPG